MRRVRLIDWDVRLPEFFEKRRNTPFAWGSNDCALFWADAIVAITGEDPAKRLRKYKNEKGALRLVAKHGSLRELVVAQGFAEISPTQAQRGDGVLLETHGLPTIFVCGGNGYAYGPGVDRLACRLMTEAVTAFEV